MLEGRSNTLCKNSCYASAGLVAWHLSPAPPLIYSGTTDVKRELQHFSNDAPCSCGQPPHSPETVAANVDLNCTHVLHNIGVTLFGEKTKKNRMTRFLNSFSSDFHFHFSRLFILHLRPGSGSSGCTFIFQFKKNSFWVECRASQRRRALIRHDRGKTSCSSQTPRSRSSTPPPTPRRCLITVRSVRSIFPRARRVQPNAMPEDKLEHK